MRKLLQGIVEFRRSRRPDYAATFARLALGQKPDALYIACSDSRVQANVFASTEPGDLFVVRNPGNLVAPAGADGLSVADESEAAAIEFSLAILQVRDIILCGHSGCGAMAALAAGRASVPTPHLRSWLRHAQAALEGLPADSRLSFADQLSQRNALLQLEHLRSYARVAEAVASGRLGLHAWWFEIAAAEVHAWDAAAGRFLPIDEEHAQRILAAAVRR